GVTLICGGLGGVMKAACQGASMEGGTTVGVLPGNNYRAANQYVQIPIVTGMGHARNALVAKSARAVIAIGGRFGTLSEVAYALINDIPVIGLNTWSLYKDGVEDESIYRARSAAEAVERAVEMAIKLGK
ncbi:MAG: LOG family protein, partial [Dehalococcoidia bacterium]|nr:LOG family protein [Dehalococcoidia bacterium]